MVTTRPYMVKKSTLGILKILHWNITVKSPPFQWRHASQQFAIADYLVCVFNCLFYGPCWRSQTNVMSCYSWWQRMKRLRRKWRSLRVVQDVILLMLELMSSWQTWRTRFDDSEQKTPRCTLTHIVCCGLTACSSNNVKDRFHWDQFVVTSS